MPVKEGAWQTHPCAALVHSTEPYVLCMYSNIKIFCSFHDVRAFFVLYLMYIGTMFVTYVYKYGPGKILFLETNNTLGSCATCKYILEEHMGGREGNRGTRYGRERRERGGGGGEEWEGGGGEGEGRGKREGEGKGSGKGMDSGRR